ncbi:hypothetical protein QTI66_27695 [Variovorax sp. J22R133]|uniref:hypothetical protein n=1 Tax=Variovorax brevis TaxID=3053503 RepID=UPI00257717BC|nr:hypothetical protein [Variovorax sp. J22R133]MDM0115964.1 hypothetical protein [Variovorax sp. J22R133]
MSHPGVTAKQDANYRPMIDPFEQQQKKDLRVELFLIAATTIVSVAALVVIFLR